MGNCCSCEEPPVDKQLHGVHVSSSHRNAHRQHGDQRQPTAPTKYAHSSKSSHENYTERGYSNELQMKINENEQLLRDIKKLKDEKKDLGTRFERLQKELDNKTAEISHLQKRLQRTEKDINGNETRYKRDIEILERKNDSLNKELDRVNKEKDELLRRYSAIVSSKFTDGNEKIADLSDHNRPTKLAERYSEIYDNEWTEAFTSLTFEKNRTEEEVCSILVHVFCVIYSTCRMKADKEWKAFIAAAQTLYKVDELPQEMTKAAKDKRKLSAGVIPEIIKQLFTKDMGKVINVEDQMKIKDFLNKSIDLCWRMAIQDPPVYVDTSLSLRDSPFNKNLFKPYTSTGDFIDFVVWPTLYLKEGGNILSKGIAQGKKFQTPKRNYDNVDIFTAKPDLLQSSVPNSNQYIETAATNQGFNEENVKTDLHPKGKETDTSGKMTPDNSLHISKDQISSDTGEDGSATENVIIKADLQNTGLGKYTKKDDSEFISSKSNVRVERKSGDSGYTTTNKSGTKSSSDTVVMSQSQPANKINYSEWNKKQNSESKTHGGMKSVIKF